MSNVIYLEVRCPLWLGYIDGFYTAGLPIEIKTSIIIQTHQRANVHVSKIVHLG